MPPTQQHPFLHKTRTHKHSGQPALKPRLNEGRQVGKDIHQWGWEETLKGNTSGRYADQKNDIFFKPEDVNISILWIKSQKHKDGHFARTICSFVYFINDFHAPQFHDDVRGDAHHFWGWAKWNWRRALIACQRRGWRARGGDGRRGFQWKGTPRWRRRRRQHWEPGIFDGQHADREGAAPGEPQRDTGEPGNRSAPPPRAGTWEGVTSEAAVHCFTTGMHHTHTHTHKWVCFYVFVTAKQANETERLYSDSSYSEMLLHVAPCNPLQDVFTNAGLISSFHSWVRFESGLFTCLLLCRDFVCFD